uniref:zinc finger BED domain-containing protein 5-like n=1 Tax=Styela clava TaxID=7725 RepID=UPI00193A9087|nr:zinc finger BED domain-containing protein 5-like [Styela clava]
MSSKKRKFDSRYLQYRFTDATENGQVVAKCVICLQSLSNDALRPSRLQRHLRTKHSSLQNKPLAFFQTREESFKKMKIVGEESFRQSSSAEVVEASYEIANMIARAKKPHNIGETLNQTMHAKSSQPFVGREKQQKANEYFSIRFHHENAH